VGTGVFYSIPSPHPPGGGESVSGQP